MKITTVPVCLVLPFSLFAQHTPQEIKKNKISKITKLSSTGDGGEAGKHEYYYDKNGNDTAYYTGGTLISKSVYSFDRTGRPVKLIRYNGDGKETETALYSYQPDGSYKISSTDKAYGMIDYQWHDKTGKLTKTQSPDSALRLYTYDAKGKLISIKTKIGQNGGTVVDLKYTYNSKGQRIKEISNGEYRWTKVFIYNERELLIKATTIASDEGVEAKTTDTYGYEFWE